MTWFRTEEEVNILIRDMVERTKGKYITQGVAFNKNCPRQMELLKNALMASISFSGLGKELLALRFNENTVREKSIVNDFIKTSMIEEKSIGNFL